MLDKKQIWAVFLFEFKMGHKAGETIRNSNIHLAQEMLTNVHCGSNGSSFAKEMRALKMRSIVAGHWTLTTTNTEPSSKLTLLQLHEKLPKNYILQSFGIWSKLQRWKTLKSECLMNWPQIKRSSFWSVIFSYSAQNNEPFLYQSVTCE